MAKIHPGKRAESLQGSSWWPHSAKIPEIGAGPSLHLAAERGGFSRTLLQAGCDPCTSVFPARNRDKAAAFQQFSWFLGTLIKLLFAKLSMRSRGIAGRAMSFHSFPKRFWGFSWGGEEQSPALAHPSGIQALWGSSTAPSGTQGLSSPWAGATKPWLAVPSSGISWTWSPFPLMERW